jgi:abortive infection bacteriophage resistance protein
VRFVKHPFPKPAKTYQDQVELLRSRGMVIADPERAAFFLQHLNYYRLGAYWLPFEASHSPHKFRVGTTFEQVLDLYVFDRELRLLVLDAIERIEVSVRAQWAYQLAHRHGPHGYLDTSIAHRDSQWQNDHRDLSREVKRSEETFIRHLLETYSEPLPPVWAVCEVMSLGLLSRWYANLKPMPTRRSIAGVYGLDEKTLQSWLHHLSHLRNVCAHHSRLWNREFTITPMMPRSKPSTLVGLFQADSRRLYNSLLILLHFLDIIAPDHHWRLRFCELIGKHVVPLDAMDFPEGWDAVAIWQGAPA